MSEMFDAAFEDAALDFDDRRDVAGWLDRACLLDDMEEARARRAVRFGDALGAALVSAAAVWSFAPALI